MKNKVNDLTAELRSSLQAMQQNLALAADIAHALVTIYLPGEDPKLLTVFKQVQPMTQVGTERPDLTGRQVRAVEEPLVARVLAKNVPLTGMREWSLGSYSHLKVFPLRDGRGHCYGAISFESVTPDDIIIAQSLELLRNLRQSVTDDPNYQRLLPSDGIMVVDPNKLIVAANNRARHMFDVMNISHVVGCRTNDVAINWPLVGMVMDTGTAESKEFTMHGLLLSARILPVVPRPKGGCAIVILQDITELRKKDEELLIKSVVIKEIHHRVKNNLQTIASLLRLQERRAQSEETKIVLRDCVNRVNSIAIVHEYLSQQDTGLIDVAKVAKGIYQAIISSMLQPDFQLQADFQAAAVQLPSDKATSIALILNELLQNTIEHAFEGRSSGSLQVHFTEEKEHFRLSISDDGIGLPEGFSLDAGRQSLGLKIIRTMAEADLQGTFTLTNQEQGGTLALVTIPKGGLEDVKEAKNTAG